MKYEKKRRQVLNLINELGIYKTLLVAGQDIELEYKLADLTITNDLFIATKILSLFGLHEKTKNNNGK